jgi:hypothetical protein
MPVLSPASPTPLDRNPGLRILVAQFDSEVGYVLSSSGPATDPPKVGCPVRLGVGRLRSRILGSKTKSHECRFLIVRPP